MTLVVTRLIGGLGNQMFQYAAGRALSYRYGAVLKLDLSGFESYSKRQYELGRFSIQAAPASSEDLDRFRIERQSNQRFLRRALGHLRERLGRSGGLPIYREPHFHFDPTVEALRPPVYLDGYWQSERYFLNYRKQLIKEFLPFAPLEPENAAFAARIDSVNSVSVHVRRGDYVHESEIAKYHGTCSPEYYSNAVGHIAARINAPHLFVFSDELEWAQKNLRFDLPITYVDANSSARAYRDVQLMSRCRHHILANSSFSWWGAWLNTDPDKIVVSPRRWFASSTNDTQDLIPVSWVRL